jgi:hypothetical protein
VFQCNAVRGANPTKYEEPPEAQKKNQVASENRQDYPYHLTGEKAAKQQSGIEWFPELLRERFV